MICNGVSYQPMDAPEMSISLVAKRFGKEADSDLAQFSSSTSPVRSPRFFVILAILLFANGKQ